MTMCFGPTKAVTSSGDPIQVAFGSLMYGVPAASVDTRHIVNVQWQLGSPTSTVADFTISNVQFY
jgi:hypothetical protein